MSLRHWLARRVSGFGPDRPDLHGRLVLIGYISRSSSRGPVFSYKVVHRERIIEARWCDPRDESRELSRSAARGNRLPPARFITSPARRCWNGHARANFPETESHPCGSGTRRHERAQDVIKLIRAGQCTVIFPKARGRSMASSSLRSRAWAGHRQNARAQSCRCASLAPQGIPSRRPAASFSAQSRSSSVSRCSSRHGLTWSGEGRELYQRLSERVMGQIAAIQIERP